MGMGAPQGRSPRRFGSCPAGLGGRNVRKSMIGQRCCIRCRDHIKETAAINQQMSERAGVRLAVEPVYAYDSRLIITIIDK